MSRPTTRPPARLRPRTVLLIAGVALVAIIALSSGGFAYLLLVAAVTGSITALFALLTGRRTWARLASRRAAAIALAGCLLVSAISAPIVGSARASQRDAALSRSTPSATPSPRATPSATPTPTPAEASVAFTEESPIDPSTVTAPTGEPDVVVADAAATRGTALALLATLPVKGKAPKTGYNRTGDFGTAWLDVDHNGCDTRFPGCFEVVRSGNAVLTTARSATV